MTREELKAAAVAMLDRAYIPYSHFPVGAALECSDGTVFTGCTGRSLQDLGCDLIGLGRHEVADEGQGVDADIEEGPAGQRTVEETVLHVIFFIAAEVHLDEAQFP